MTSSPPTTSVLIATWQRPKLLERVVRSLCVQTLLPTEIIVCWQNNDLESCQMLKQLQAEPLPCPLVVVHLPENGIVPAENAALQASSGELILLIDDDAIAPVDWIHRIVRFYASHPNCGAFGGPADCWTATGERLPINPKKPVAGLSWIGRLTTNLHDQPPEWRALPPEKVDHLVGYNMSLRRSAFDRFEDRLKPYWQLFELDACLTASSRGFEIWFDPGLLVEHRVGYTTGAYAPGRDGDWSIRFANSSYNQAYVISKHSKPFWKRNFRWLYLMALGTGNTPGPMLLPITILRNGQPFREIRLMITCLKSKHNGWRMGRNASTPDSTNRSAEHDSERF